MGQKVNPTGFRLGVNKTWDSKWFSKREFAKNLNEDINIRGYILKKYPDGNIAKVEISRAAKQVLVRIYSSRPGRLIGKQGAGIELMRTKISSTLNSPDKSLKVDIFEVKSPDTNSRLLALNVAQQLEKRVSFRRAMKKAMQQANKAGVKGIKVRIAGRLNGADIARAEWYMDGRVPLHTLRADIDYATAEAMTTYGLIGVKVWTYKGEIYNKPSSRIAKGEE